MATQRVAAGQQVDDRFEGAGVAGGLVQEDEAWAIAGLAVVDLAVVEGDVAFSGRAHERPAIPAIAASASTPSVGT